MENPPKKFFRLTPGGEIRLKHAYIIKCESVLKDESGNIIELHCSYDPESKSGGATSGRKIKGTSHWVSAPHAAEAEVRLYDKLFMSENPDEEADGLDYKANLNPESLEVLKNCMVEPALKQAKCGEKFQFLRQGYFSVDNDSNDSKPVFNRIVPLRDTWAKVQNRS